MSKIYIITSINYAPFNGNQVIKMKSMREKLFGIKTDSSPKEVPLRTSDDNTSVSNEEYKKIGKKFLEASLEILNSSENWTLEKRTSEGHTVHSKYLPNREKVFKLTAEIDLPLKTVMNILKDTRSHPKWNPTTKEARVLKTIDEHSELNYQVSSPLCGGLISSRDFVSVRYGEERDGTYFYTGVPVIHPEAPLKPGYIRGEVGPNCWIFRPVPGEEDRCVFQWLQNVKFNGWLPQFAVDAAQATALLDYTKHVRDYGKRLR